MVDTEHPSDTILINTTHWYWQKKWLLQ